MKFMKFGKALLIGALSAGVILSVTSCVQSYSVGYLYVTGTATSQSNGNGIISGFKIDHNTGKLTAINGLPVSSGGANPVRAILLNSSRFLYVLNRGVNANGNSDCYGTVAPNVCSGANITQFAVGANGILTAQQTFYTQGFNPIRMIPDSGGGYIYVLDHDAPSSAACASALGSSVTSCGDITAFQVNSTTGRLQLVVNAQVSSASGAALPYFPVPANPIDFLMNSGTVLTLNGTPSTGDTVFPYQYSQTNGQLTVTLNSSDSIGNVNYATAIVGTSGFVFILDNEAPSGSNPTNAHSQILPFTVSGSALVAETSGPIADDPTLSNPVYLVLGQPGGKWLYVANQGNNVQNSPQSGIAGYTINTPFQPSQLPGSPFSTGAGPQCLVEDPSNQFFYTANFNDSTVTGMQVNEQSGGLRPLSDATKAPNSYPLTGQPTWCLVDGRTS
jgi:6-phosphogluconolactonase (cycloisomerase 2 family)